MFQAWCARQREGMQWHMEVLGDLTVSQTKNEPACLRATFIRDDMTVEPGDTILIRIDDQGSANLFYGYVESSAKHDNKVDVVAYDQLYFMKISPITKVYGDIKASDLFQRMAEEKKLQFAADGIEDTGYPIPGVVADNVNPLDLMNEALNVTFNHDGKRFFMWDDCNDLRLASEDSLAIDPATFKIQYNNTQNQVYSEDASELVNEVIVYKDSEGNFDELSAARNEDLMNWYGRRTKYNKVNSDENTQVIADNMLKENQDLKRKLSVTLFGDNVYIFPGRTIEVDYYHKDGGRIQEYIWGTFMIDSVTHTLSGGTAKMDLELTLKEMHEFV